MSNDEQMGTPTRRRGRPRLQEDVVRSNRVVTFVTNEELRLIAEIADRESSSISSVCHQLVAAGLEDRQSSG